jgi:hypothetical protein
MQTFSTYSLNQSACASLLIRHSVFPAQASWLVLFTLFFTFFTFVNNFHFNLVVMFVNSANQFSVINLIYSKKLVLLLYGEKCFIALALVLHPSATFLS